MKFSATRPTVKYGNSTYVVLDKSWGIKPQEIVRIEVEPTGRFKKADDDSGVDSEETD